MESLKRIDSVVALSLIASFFMPWAQMLGLGVSGYTLGRIGSYANLAWAIPILSATIVLVALRGGDTRVLAVITGLLPFVALIYGLTKAGPDLFHVLAIGAYLTLAGGATLVLSSFGKIRPGDSSRTSAG